MSNIESWSMYSLFKITCHKHVVVRSVVFSPNGEYLASGSNTIEVWRVSSGERIITLKGHSG